MKFIGLDISISSTGFCYLAADGTFLDSGTVRIKKEKEKDLIGKSKCEQDMVRFGKIAYCVIDEIKPCPNDIICIEGYAYTAKGNSLTRLAEVNGIIKFLILQRKVDPKNVILCSPSTLKRFVTGKGQAKKGIMIKEVWRKWKFDTTDDNEADAYALAQFVYTAINKYRTLRAEAKDCANVLLDNTPWLSKVKDADGPLFVPGRHNKSRAKDNMPPADPIIDRPATQCPGRLPKRKSRVKPTRRKLNA